MALTTWIENKLKGEVFALSEIQGDASFRSYYRVRTDNTTYIAMVAPPEKERTDIFVHIARAWKTHGLSVPTIIEWDIEQGFVLLSDFGDVLLLDVLEPQNVDHFYSIAMKNITSLQSFNGPLPSFDEAYVRRELGLFREWFVEKLLGLTITPPVDALLEKWNKELIHIITSQPQVAIHRDYHARNLMVLDTQALGIIDFQDAMVGPITYDAVSLLKDCYIRWPREKVCHWVENFRMMMKNTASVDPALFLQWFDGVGLQRHLKVLGIFSRLKIRDQKARYMQDVPRILHYILEVTGQYPSFKEYDDWLRSAIPTSVIEDEMQCVP
jgi:N-acetylmuramate 1-kinase